MNCLDDQAIALCDRGVVAYDLGGNPSRCRELKCIACCVVIGQYQRPDLMGVIDGRLVNCFKIRGSSTSESPDSEAWVASKCTCSLKHGWASLRLRRGQRRHLRPGPHQISKSQVPEIRQI